jgi:hypothetical protein
MVFQSGSSVPTASELLTGVKRKMAKKTSGLAKRVSGLKESKKKEILFAESPIPGKAPQPPYIWIDYPQEGETLFGSNYVIRLGVGGADSVDISIDRGSWLPCRFAAGYWWHDWTATPGKHTIVARMQTADGRCYKTPLRNCQGKF